MDSRSPVAFLPQNTLLNTFPRLVTPKSPPRLSPSPSSATSHRLSPPSLPKPAPLSAKRKASAFPDDNEDGDDMSSTSPQPPHRTLKRPRQSPTSSHKRPLPISRVLDNLDRPALVTLISTLITRHPDLTPEVQSLAPKVTPQTAMTAITKLEQAFRASFPYGGDKTGEYAYSRVHSAYNSLLAAIADYTTHFLPPTSISAAELLSFLDSITHLLHRIPLFHNPIHNIARDTAFADITGAWEVATRYFLEQNGSFAFILGGWMERLEAHAEKEGVLRQMVEDIRQQVSWTRDGQRR
jgi:protein Cut8